MAGRAWGQPPSVEDLVEQINVQQGPEAYVIVREIWGKWGSGEDPRAVDAALRRVASDETLPSSVREYAAFFAAHARTRLGDIAGARDAIRSLGYVNSWHVAGPFDNEGKHGFATGYGPEAQLTVPLSEARAFSGKSRAVRFRSLPTSAAELGWLNAASLFRPAENVCFYARTYVQLEQPRRLRLSAGVRGAFRLYVDDVTVLEEAAYRGHDVDRLRREVDAPAGLHAITLKACGTELAPIVSLRITDSQGGAVTALADWSLAAAMQPPSQPVRPHGPVTGTLPEFDGWIAKAPEDANAHYQFAKYLAQSHGEDPAQEQARDLALRAVELRPGTRELLLAAGLAEDGNQARRWIERAEAVATSAEEHYRVLRGRAELERGSVDWRSAARLFEKALQEHPTDVEVLGGYVEILRRVGLRRVALVAIERALERAPYCVNLLNLHASELRGLGMLEAARMAEDRYALFRADDPEYLRSRMQLALNRGHAYAVRHFAQRLAETQPDSAWVSEQVADAYLQLGEHGRARAELERALLYAPNDVGVLSALADLQGLLGDRAEQLRSLRAVAELRPQDGDVQQYIAFLEPQAAQLDESFAVPAADFLARRNADASGEVHRELLDLTVKTVYDNGLSHEFRQIAFQPLTSAAAALARSYSFQFEASTQRVQLRGAKVYRTDGRVDRAIETGVGEANDPSISMYTSARTYNVQFPRLEAGDVVELQYRIEDVASRNEHGDYFGDIHYFQDGSSIQRAEYVLITPEHRTFYIDVHGMPDLQRASFVRDGQRIMRFQRHAVPALDAEPGMPPWPEVVPFVHVSTYDSYDSLGRWYWGLVRDQFELDDTTRQLAHKLVKDAPDARAKVAAIYRWVIDNTRYVALEFGIWGIKPRRCVQTVARGFGDCKDKATVIVALLKEVGIDAELVLVRTGLRGRFDSKVASLAPFDHAIAYVPSLDLYLDGTAVATGTGELPAMDQGAMALRVGPAQARPVVLPVMAARDNRDSLRVHLALGVEGQAEFDATFEVSGIRASAWRQRLASPSTRAARLAGQLNAEFPGVEIQPSSVRLQAEDYERPVTGAARGVVPRLFWREAGTARVPLAPKLGLVDRFASLATRRHPVDLEAFGTVERDYHIRLPPGGRVASLPKEASLRTRFGGFERIVTVENGSLHAHSKLWLDVQRVEPRDYPAFRAFCLAADAALAETATVSL